MIVLESKKTSIHKLFWLLFDLNIVVFITQSLAYLGGMLNWNVGTAKIF